MFRRFLVLLVIFSMFVLGVTVFAMEHDNSWVENGNRTPASTRRWAPEKGM